MFQYPRKSLSQIWALNFVRMLHIQTKSSSVRDSERSQALQFTKKDLEISGLVLQSKLRITPMRRNLQWPRKKEGCGLRRN